MQVVEGNAGSTLCEKEGQEVGHSRVAQEDESISSWYFSYSLSLTLDLSSDSRRDIALNGIDLLGTPLYEFEWRKVIIRTE